MKAIFLLHIATTLMLTGLIWLIQLVHYPLFAKVGSTYTEYQAAHVKQITPLVFPLMTIELFTGFFLLGAVNFFPAWSVILGLILIGIVWLATAFLAVPRHNELSAGWNPDAHRALVSGNWIRTIAWTARSGLILWMLAQVIHLE